MSTSMLYHAWGLRGYDHVRTEYQEGKVFFYARPKDEIVTCPTCGSRQVIRHGAAEREFRALPIGSKKVRIVVL